MLSEGKIYFDQVALFSCTYKCTSCQINWHEEPGHPVSPDVVDSGDKQIPTCHVHRPLSKQRLPVEEAIRHLFQMHRTARCLGLFNAIGKEFFRAVGKYVDLCTREDLRQPSAFLYLNSTSTGEQQPGGAYINWFVTARPLKSGTRAKKIVQHDCYADNVTYDEAQSKMKVHHQKVRTMNTW